MTGDGAADVIFRHTSGDVVVWDIDDSKITSKTVLAQRATGFTIVGFPDVDGDNIQDTLETGLGNAVSSETEKPGPRVYLGFGTGW